MANIFLTDKCNLRCPYCFASEFVGAGHSDIGFEAFAKAADFILADGIRDSLGLIGGEPTLHGDFKRILMAVIGDARVRACTVYTNGILVKEHLNELAHPKFRLLVNCNHPDRMPAHAYGALIDSLDAAIFERHMDDRVSLGLNIDSPDFDTSFIMELLERYRRKRLRISVTVPNSDELRGCSPLEYLGAFKPALKDFFARLLGQGIVPYYDCNKLPGCLLDDGDFAGFERYLSSRPNHLLPTSSVQSKRSVCRPVIDIMPDLTAVRCFGLSDCTKVPIGDFDSIADLERYYLINIDGPAARISHSRECLDCDLRRCGGCMGGCLAYKIDDVSRLGEIEEEYLRGKFPDRR